MSRSGAHYAAKTDIAYRVADYPTAQAAIDAAPASSFVLFPPGNTAINAPLQITKPVTLLGAGGYTSRILANSCNGIVMSATVNDFHMDTIEIAQAVRYTTTANTFTGISVNGTSAENPSNHTYTDVYVDGFQTAFYSNYLWSSVFRGFSTGYGLVGIDAYGKSVNNFVTGGSRLSANSGAGSRAIRLTGNDGSSTGTAVGSEGWTIGDTLTVDAEIGIEFIGVANSKVHDCILDFNTGRGVYVHDNGTNFAGNINIIDTYIALTGTAGTAAIENGNNVSNSANAGLMISDCQLLTYSGSSATYGVFQSGSYAKTKVRGGSIQNFVSSDIQFQSSGNLVDGVSCLSTGQPGGNVYSTGTNINTVVNLMAGTVYTSFHRIVQTNTGAIPTLVCDQAPASGTWPVGAYCRNLTPAVGSPKGWICTVAGTPGTWVSEGNL